MNTITETIQVEPVRERTAEDEERLAKFQVERAIEELSNLEYPAGEHDSYWEATRDLDQVRDRLRAADKAIGRAYRLRFPIGGREEEA